MVRENGARGPKSGSAVTSDISITHLHRDGVVDTCASGAAAVEVVHLPRCAKWLMLAKVWCRMRLVVVVLVAPVALLAALLILLPSSILPHAAAGWVAVEVRPTAASRE